MLAGLWLPSIFDMVGGPARIFTPLPGSSGAQVAQGRHNWEHQPVIM
jgi:hypothetical protein